MTATVLTFIADVAPERRQQLDTAVATLQHAANAAMQAPFSAIPMLHFASVVVFDGDHARGLPILLVFESNIDGLIGPYIATLVSVAAREIHALFRCCQDYAVTAPTSRAELISYLEQHVVHPNAWHVGNFSHTADRIIREAKLSQDVSARIDERLLAGGRPDTPDTARRMIDSQYHAAGEFAWVPKPDGEPTWSDRTGPKIKLGVMIALVIGTLPALAVIRDQHWWSVLIGAGADLVLAVVYLAVLRWHESQDVTQPKAALNPALVKQLESQEDRHVQNHLASLTTVKPGLFRKLTLRVVLWAANLLARTSIHGKLAGIPSIHFAHWALVDKGRRLLFLSNFDGSWESYLDDFIDQASRGLTGIWTNTVGFPETRWLIFEGARNGVAFKAFARSQQVPTGVWYSAYPDLTVQQIALNSTIRAGLAAAPARPGALTEWLRAW